MLFIFFSTIVFYLFFQSIGNAFLRFLHINEDNPFLSVWIGFFFAALLALLLSIWLPLDSVFSRLTILASALPGIMPTCHAWQKIFAGIDRRTLLICGCSLSVLLIIQGVFSCFGSIPFDTGTYHQQIVRWLKEYGHVPGVGNVHCRLAQISGWLALAAIVDWGPFQERAIFIVPPLCLLSALLYFFYGACKSGDFKKRIYLLCLLALCCIYTSDFSKSFLISSPSLYYDRSALLLYCIFVAELFSVFFMDKNSKINISKFQIVSILLCASILFKPFAIPAVIFYIILLFINFYKKRIDFRNLVRIAWLPFFTAILWLGINCILSGYPLFPFSFYHIPTDWVMLKADIDYERRAVQGYARWPQADWDKALDAGIRYWFFPWLRRFVSVKVFWVAALAPLLLGGVLWCVAFCKKENLGPKVFFFFLALLHLVYWFFQHPDLRFGLEFFWSWLALAVAFSAPQKLFINFRWSRLVCFLMLLMAVIACSQCIPALVSKNWDGLFFRRLLTPDRYVASMEVKPHIFHSGTAEEFIMYSPVPKHVFCGNGPLPCAPHIKENLFMRVPGNLGAGYTYNKKLN